MYRFAGPLQRTSALAWGMHLTSSIVLFYGPLQPDGGSGTSAGPGDRKEMHSGGLQLVGGRHVRTADLPVALTRLIGREQELGELRGLLAQTRLLTLVGAGGVGKTRLAIELASLLQDTYRDGVRVVQLAALADAQLVAHEIAAACEVLEPPRGLLLDQLTRILRSRHLLLVLDNCEHVLDACAQVAETLLAACPSVSILATSRERLGLAGETSWRVPSLAFPSPQAPPSPDRLEEYSSLGLFLQRAVEVVPGFAVTSPADVDALAAICFALDGIPLALELAAARLPALSLQELASRIDDRFRLLAGVRRAGPRRHQTLRASLDWSHELLTEPEQAAFRRLSVFAGGWSLDAAEDLLGEQALDLLARLVDKSLVQRHERRGHTRYALLETIRAYAAERLASRGEEPEWGARHAAHYLAMAEEVAPGLRGPDQQQCLERLDVELDNLRAAARWFAADISRAHEGLRLAAALWEFCQVRGYLGEAARWLETTLHSDPRPSLARARALDGSGVMAALGGDNARAQPLFAASAELFAALGGLAGQSQATSHLCISAAMYGDPRRAVELGYEALALVHSSGDRTVEALVQYNLGWAGRLVGNAELAMRCSLEAAALGAEVGDQRGRAFALDQLGSLLLEAGRAGEALEALREAAWRFDLLGDAWGLVVVLSHLVGTMAAMGSFEAAAQLLGAGQALRARTGAELLPLFRKAEDQGADTARAGLGTRAFEAAVARGRDQSRDQVLARALGSPVESTSSDATPQQSVLKLLTRREREVVRLIAEGLTNREIADRLVISERTADTHVHNILVKLNCATRIQVALLITQHEGPGT